MARSDGRDGGAGSGVSARISRRVAAGGLGVLLTGLAFGPMRLRGQTAQTQPQTQAPASAPDASGAPGCEAQARADARRGRLAKALRRGFGVQYWGTGFTAEALAAAPHGMLIVEATTIGAKYAQMGRDVLFTREEVRRISCDGTRPVLGYVNVSEVEHYRDYWMTLERRLLRGDPVPAQDYDWLGPARADGEQLARYWRASWQALIEARIDQLMALGFDGVFLDDVLQYYTYGSAPSGSAQPGDPQDMRGFADAMMTLVEAAARRARAAHCDAIVVVNNGVFIGRDGSPGPVPTTAAAAGDAEAPTLFQRYTAAIDGILIENAFAPGAPQQPRDVMAEDFGAKGIALLSIDFADGASGDAEATARAAAKAGFAPYVAEDGSFSRLSPPVVDPEVALLAR